MSSLKTDKLGLNKWVPTDYVNMGEFNDNFQKIDDAYKDVTTQLADKAQQSDLIEVENTGSISNSILNESEVEIIGHRGFPHLAPENTIVSFNSAIRYGADSLEFDVQISKDGIPVVIHDPTVDRTTNGTGNVKDLTLSQLKALDAGIKFSSIYSGVTIPTLSEVLIACKNKSKFIYPEIKSYRSTDDIALIVNQVISHGFEGHCVMQSFNYSDFVFVRAISKKITLGYLVSSVTEFNSALASAETDGNSVILINLATLFNNTQFVEQARAKGVGIVLWTVDNSYDVQSALKIGVKRMLSNKLQGVVL